MSGPANCYHCDRLVEDVDEVVLHRSCASGHDNSVPPHCVWEGDEGFVCGMPKDFPWHVDSGDDETMHRYVPSDGVKVPDGITAIMVPPRTMTAHDVESMYRVLHDARGDGRIMFGEPGWTVYQLPRITALLSALKEASDFLEVPWNPAGDCDFCGRWAKEPVHFDGCPWVRWRASVDSLLAVTP